MKYQGANFDVDGDETVLDVLLRHQQNISHSCKSGTCQTCVLQAVSGEVSEQSQRGLKETAVARKHFLSCQQPASTITEVAQVDDNTLFSHALLVDKFLYAPDVLCLKLEPINPHYYHAGQFINLRNLAGEIRSYSIANVPATEPYIELHIQKIPDGKMSSWLFDDFTIGDLIDFQGPLGNCFYTNNEPEHQLMLIGTGTGAAPLLGIAKDALYKKHSGDIHFYHGVRTFESLYLHHQLTELANQHANFHYHPCLSNDSLSSDNGISHGRASVIGLKAITQPASTKLYLCGNPDMVNTTRKMAFLSGVPSNSIFVDPFEYS